MGVFTNSPLVKVVAWTVSGIIMVLNAYLLFETFTG
jgi:manganese transport protein